MENYCYNTPYVQLFCFSFSQVTCREVLSRDANFATRFVDPEDGKTKIGVRMLCPACRSNNFIKPEKKWYNKVSVCPGLDMYRIPRGFPPGGGIFFFLNRSPRGENPETRGICFFFTYPGGKTPCECFQAEKVVVGGGNRLGGGEPRGTRYLACALLLCSGFPTFFSGLFMWR